MNVAILISGSGSNMVRLVEEMQSGSINAIPALVISNDPSAKGLEKAESLGVPTSVVDHKTYSDRTAFEAEMDRVLRKADIDLICLAGFMRILSSAFVSQWTDRILNIHPSLLPKYKGLNTHARAIEAGDKAAGCSVHIVNSNIDDGPILGQRSVEIQPNDTPETLAERVLVEEHKLYPEILKTYVDRLRTET